MSPYTPELIHDGDDALASDAAGWEGPSFPYRVFGVGMNKTGTSSLKRALVKLGVGPAVTPSAVKRARLNDLLFATGDFEPALRFASMYRTFEDRPWNVWDMYRRLDERYPGSRFILTVRDPDSWWSSVHRWITVSKPYVAERYRQHLRASSLDRSHLVAGYLRHNQEIMEYFQGRTDFLLFNLTGGDGWEALCAFLNLPVPQCPFPHANRQTYDQDDALRHLKRRVRQTFRSNAEEKDTPLGSGHCVRCGFKLQLNRKRRRRNQLVRLPDLVKEPYRWLQRKAYLVPPPHPAQAQRRVEALRSRHPSLTLDGMAVVSCLFNPGASPLRLDNFRTFRRQLDACGLPVLTVELAVGNDPFLLGPGDGEVLALRSEQPMWQKERLINLGIAELLRRGCDRVVWLDADVMFDDPEGWPWMVASALEQARLCQVFGHVRVDQGPGRKPVPGISALRYHERTGRWADQNPLTPCLRHPLGLPNGYSGFGWAARAELLREVPLYDRAVVGGGDKLIFGASVPRGEQWDLLVSKLFQSNYGPCEGCGHANEAPAYLADYLAWAASWRAALDGQVVCAPLGMRSLFHGRHKNRHYQLRRDILLRHAFDPALDLELDAQGCWRWGSDKTPMHLQIQSYFFEREENA